MIVLKIPLQMIARRSANGFVFGRALSCWIERDSSYRLRAITIQQLRLRGMVVARIWRDRFLGEERLEQHLSVFVPFRAL